MNYYQFIFAINSQGAYDNKYILNTSWIDLLTIITIEVLVSLVSLILLIWFVSVHIIVYFDSYYEYRFLPT